MRRPRDVRVVGPPRTAARHAKAPTPGQPRPLWRVRQTACLALAGSFVGCGAARAPAPTLHTAVFAGASYVRIPSGSFEMGCGPSQGRCYDDAPAHLVTLTRGIWLMRTEVTVAEYRRYVEAVGKAMPPPPQLPRIMAEPAGPPPWSQGDHPILNVTWMEASAYCAWAGGRLPTEAEWEYAARGGLSGKLYPWGNDPPSLKARRRNGACFAPFGAHDWLLRRTDWRPGTVPVGLYQPNGYGLFDMAGNVAEWCADWFGAYEASAAVDPEGPPEGTHRVLRGGAWSSSEFNVRVSPRGRAAPDFAGTGMVGVRCARDAE